MKDDISILMEHRDIQNEDAHYLKTMYVNYEVANYLFWLHARFVVGHRPGFLLTHGTKKIT